jgi:hypothetical protein
LIYKNGYLSINGNTLHTKFKSADLNIGVEMQDNTLQGQNTKTSVPGLKTWSLTVEFGGDFDPSGVDDIMFGLWGAAAFTVELRPDNSAVADTNPSFIGQAVLASYQVIKASVGQYMIVQATFSAAGDLARSET